MAVYPSTVRGRQTYTNDGAKTTTTKYVPNASSASATSLSSYTSKPTTTPSASYVDKTNQMINDYKASLNNSSSNTKTSYTPQGSVSTAVVAGRADPVPSSNVNTSNSYYTVYDGTNRTAIDSKTGQVVGTASGAYNSPSNPPYVPPTGGTDTGSSSGSGSGSGNYSGSSSSSSSEYTSAQQKADDLLKTMEDLIAEQRRKAEEAYKAQLEEEYAKNRLSWRNNADQINLNRARAERLSRNQFGEESGANNTNMARIGAGWASSHNENNRNLASNDSTALSNYNSNLADAYNTVASAYSNFIMPVRTNRLNYLDELDFRRKANEQDYDYRKFLANAGLM